MLMLWKIYQFSSLFLVRYVMNILHCISLINNPVQFKINKVIFKQSIINNTNKKTIPCYRWTFKSIVNFKIPWTSIIEMWKHRNGISICDPLFDIFSQSIWKHFSVKVLLKRTELIFWLEIFNTKYKKKIFK